MRSIDFGAIFKSVWPPFSAWTVAVLVVGFGGHQPGVVCVTPVAWLMALWAGLRCAAYNRSDTKGARLTAAALAGGLLGVLQGVLFVVVTPFMGAIRPDEQQKAIVLDVVMVVLGTIVSAVLSLAIAASQERRRTAI